MNYWREIWSRLLGGGVLAGSILEEQSEGLYNKMEVKTKARSNLAFFLFSFLPLLLSAAQLAQQPIILENCLWQELASLHYFIGILFSSGCTQTGLLEKFNIFLVEAMKTWAKSHSRDVPKLSWVWVGDHGGCFVCILRVGSGMCHLLGPGSHCPRCCWHLRDAVHVCTAKMVACLLGPVSPQIKDRSLRARLFSLLPNSVGCNCQSLSYRQCWYCDNLYAGMEYSHHKSMAICILAWMYHYLNLNSSVLTFASFTWCCRIIFVFIFEKVAKILKAWKFISCW